MAWQRLTPALPPAIQTAGQALSTGLDAARLALQAATLELRAATALGSELASGRGAVVSALSALEGAVRSAVQGLLDDAGGYLLIVPLPKKGIVDLVQGVEAETEDVPVGALNAQVPQTVRGLAAWRTAFSGNRIFVGGNAHFLKTVAASLYDAGDQSRPRFSADTYWGYVAIVGGSTDLGAALSLASYLDRLLSPLATANGVSANRSIPDLVARNVRATPSGRGNFAVVEWSPVTSASVEGGYWRVVPTHYAIIRSKRPEAATARRVLDLFPSRVLTAGMQGRYGAQVLTVREHDAFSGRFLDDASLATDTTFYYHVAFRTRLEGDEGSTDAGYDLLSSAARYRPVDKPTGSPRLGVSPDWYRTPTLSRLLPVVDRLLDRLLDSVDRISGFGSRAESLGTAAIEAIEAQIAQLTRVAQELEVLLAQLEQVLSTPDAGAHITSRQGTGNVSKLLADLAQELDNKDDPKRPAFDTGDEYVTGAIIVITAPNAASFESAWALLELLFGPAQEKDPVVEGIESVTALAEEAASLASDPVPSQAFNADMTPRAAGESDSRCETRTS